MALAGLPTIALAQVEVLPGRPDLNLARMLAYIREARQSEAEVVVFPELCLSGNVVGDLWEVDVLVEDLQSGTHTAEETVFRVRR